MPLIQWVMQNLDMGVPSITGSGGLTLGGSADCRIVKKNFEYVASGGIIISGHIDDVIFVSVSVSIVADTTLWATAASCDEPKNKYCCSNGTTSTKATPYSADTLRWRGVYGRPAVALVPAITACRLPSIRPKEIIVAGPLPITRLKTLHDPIIEDGTNSDSQIVAANMGKWAGGRPASALVPAMTAIHLTPNRQEEETLGPSPIGRLKTLHDPVVEDGTSDTSK